jgi:hypothetical protein
MIGITGTYLLKIHVVCGVELSGADVGLGWNPNEEPSAPNFVARRSVGGLSYAYGPVLYPQSVRYCIRSKLRSGTSGELPSTSCREKLASFRPYVGETSKG